jgi:hypothetical protein
MNTEYAFKKRKTIRIQLPRKPAAPRHPHAVARAIPMPNPVALSGGKRSMFLFPLVQAAVASALSMTVLDAGHCSRMVAFAALGYAVGLALIAPRRHALTRADALLIRWGFPMLCVLSFLSRLIWMLRGNLL